MKKKNLLMTGFLFLFTTTSIFGAYNPSDKDLVLFEKAKIQINKIYDKTPSKAYGVKNSISKLYIKYKNSEEGVYFLKYMEKITNDYISDYEKKNQNTNTNNNSSTNTTDNNTESQTIPKIDNVINTLNEKLSTLSKETTTISQFDITPKNDSVNLKNIYLENVGTVNDISRIIEEVYLVNSDNKIYAKGYVQGKYIYFNIYSQIVLKEGANNHLFVKAVFRDSNNQNEIGELKFSLSSPSDADFGTLNGIRATSYSNGQYTTINDTKIDNPIVTHISYNNTSVYGDSSFKPTYNEALSFSIYNNSKTQLDLKSFDVKIQGSAISTFSPNTRFFIKVKGTNQIFGTGLISERNTSSGILRINYGGGNAYNYISPNSKTEYILEIDHDSANPSGSREVRLENMVIGDGFGGTISDLNNYSNTGVPSNYNVYRY